MLDLTPGLLARYNSYGCLDRHWTSTSSDNGPRRLTERNISSRPSLSHVSRRSHIRHMYPFAAVGRDSGLHLWPFTRIPDAICGPSQDTDLYEPPPPWLPAGSLCAQAGAKSGGRPDNYVLYEQSLWTSGFKHVTSNPGEAKKQRVWKPRMKPDHAAINDMLHLCWLQWCHENPPQLLPMTFHPLPCAGRKPRLWTRSTPSGRCTSIETRKRIIEVVGHGELMTKHASERIIRVLKE